MKIGLIDTVLVIVSFLTAISIIYEFPSNNIDPFLWDSFIIFLSIWILVSHFSQKFRIGKHNPYKEILASILISNFIVLSLISLLLLIFSQLKYPVLLIFGTILFTTLMEMILSYLYYSLMHSDFLQEWIGPEYINGNGKNGKPIRKENGFQNSSFPQEILNEQISKDFLTLKKSITEESGDRVAQWLTHQIEIANPRTLLISTETRFNLDNQPENFFSTIVNLARINNIQRINKFFESVNSKLPVGGVFIGCGETYLLRKRRIFKKYPPLLNYFIYSIDFILNRVCPKVKLTRKFFSKS